ncbi:MAG TPA: hypothetical protein VEO00_04260 [Actinomycetota bacterium]|nr:hypothetical protein [Actinomycetota bacterium]
MERGELIFANAVDDRVRTSGDDGGPTGAYVPSLPGRALPFWLIRHYKAPAGLVGETIQFVAPSGRTTYEWGPRARRMVGMMDVTRQEDLITDARFVEGGVHLATFLLDEVPVGQFEFEVVLQASTGSLPAEVERGLKNTDVIWVGLEHEGRDVAAPSWYVYQQGKLYVISDPDRKAGEQFVPGIPDSDEVVVITRREKGKDTALHRFMAAVRVIDPSSPEYDRLAGVLADRRRSRVGPAQESIQRWKKAGVVIGELTPAV